MFSKAEKKDKKLNIKELLIIQENLNVISFKLKKVKDEEEREKLLKILEMIKLELYQVHKKLNKEDRLNNIRKKSIQINKRVQELSR